MTDPSDGEMTAAAAKNPPLPWPVHPAAGLFPLLGDDELAGLAADIREHGQHEPVWLWDDPQRGTVLLDGRNRARACQLAGTRIRTRRYTGTDPIAFSVSANEKRRHLTAGQRDFLALGVEKLYAAEAKVGRPSADERETRADLHEFTSHERRSDVRAAKVVKASGRGVSQAKRIQREAPDLAEKVKAGQISIDRAERIVRDREAERKRIEQARREAAAQPEPTLVDIRHGDFREVLADLSGVDAVITDPPYQHEFIPLLGDLAAWADKVLNPDGVLAVLAGQFWLPEVYRLLDGHRPYRWTACYLTPGIGYQALNRKVQANWKPLIVYGGNRSFSDIIRSEGRDAAAKSNHKWGQDYGAFHTIVERLTERGQTVADPFAGSGTTLAACRALGRHSVGADTDPAAVAAARERLS